VSTVFDIGFTASEPELQEDGWAGLWGRTILGDYSESFIAPVTLWSREAYEQHWIEAAQRVLGPLARSAFFTTAFRFWWTMWRDGERILVHEELLTPERIEGVTDFARAPYDLIGAYAAISDEGERISQWQISAEDMRGFLARRVGSYVPT
jgi:hypothetical protein